MVGSAGVAQADLVPVGNLGTLTPSAHVSFANPNVTVGTVATVGAITYNFLDQYVFNLAASADVSALVATINFVAGPSGPSLFGVSNLQVNLWQVPLVGSPLVSWLSVTSPGAGLEQVIALVPPSPLVAGAYELQVRGVLTSPGSYSGSLIAAAPAAVPLPAALPMLVIGLGALGAVGARRRESADAT